MKLLKSLYVGAVPPIVLLSLVMASCGNNSSPSALLPNPSEVETAVEVSSEEFLSTSGDEDPETSLLFGSHFFPELGPPIPPTPTPSATTRVEIALRTGGDDLRQGSYANFYIKLRNQPLQRFSNFTNQQVLPNDSFREFGVNVPGLTFPGEVEYCEIEHVTQESFGETADNWNLDMALVIMRPGRGVFPIVICESNTLHRFQGNTRRLRLQPAR